MKKTIKTIFTLLILIIFLAGCSSRTTPEVISFPEEIGSYALEDRKDEPTRCEVFEKGMKSTHDKDTNE